jgi:hypothetical protein
MAGGVVTHGDNIGFEAGHLVPQILAKGVGNNGGLSTLRNPEAAMPVPDNIHVLDTTSYVWLNWWKC